MTDKREYSPENADQPADEVLAEFIRRRDAGEQVDVESLCAARPDLADALRSYADGEAMFREMAADDSVAGASALAETVRPGAGRDTDASMTGRSFGNYRIVRQLGQGGMGAVYLAEDTTLQRHVALKIPRFTAADGPDARERFFREARSAAALTHPHICPVFHADEMDGTPFIAMAFVDGQPLSRFVGTPEFRDQRRVAELVRLVADALQHAHDQGFIHRDLKPGNIMLDRDGKPVVTDFGLARRLVPNQESQITQEGQLVGTPAYMSPEQIAGKSGTISSSTDIYALGVVLFELLACRLPFQGSVPEVIAGALKSEPPKLSSLRSDVSLDLQALCLQMLRKEPDQRPRSMRDVANRLQKWLDKSSPESKARQEAAQKLKDELTVERERIEKALRAGKFEAALKRLKDLARRQEPEAAEFREWALEQIPRVKARPAEAKHNEPDMLRMAQEWMRKHDYAQAIQILRAIPDVYRSEEAEDLLLEATELQTEAEDLLLDLKHCVKERIYDGIDDNLKRLLELKPGNQFAKNLHQRLQGYRSGRGRGRPYRFDNKGRLLAVNEDHFWSRAMTLSAVVGAAVFGLMTWGITIYLKSGEQIVAVHVDEQWLEQQGYGMTLSVDGTEHTIAGPEMELEISAGEHGFTIRDRGRVIHNPQTFTIEDKGRQVIRIDATGMHLADRAPPTDDPSSVANTNHDQSPLDATLIPTNVAKAITWSTVSDAPRTPLPDGVPGLVTTLPWKTEKGGPARSLTVSPDGRNLAVIGSGGSRVWDLETGNTIDEYDGTAGFRAEFSPDGKSLYAQHWSTTIARHDAPSFKKAMTLELADGHCQSLTLSADGRTIAGHLSDYGDICLWNTETGRIIKRFSGSPTSWGDIRFLPDGRHVLALGRFRNKGPDEYGIRLLDTQTGQVVRQYLFGGKPMVVSAYLMTVSPDGKYFLMSTDFRQRFVMVDVEQGDYVADALFEEGNVTESAFLQDGKHVLIAVGNTLVIWNPSTRQELQRFTIPFSGTAVLDIDISPDGRFAFTASGASGKEAPDFVLPEEHVDIHVWRLPKEVWPKTNVGGQSPPYATAISGQSPPSATQTQKKNKRLRGGIIGLDTSHCAAFARILNEGAQDGELAGVRMVAAYPRGSPDIPSSVSKVPKQLAKMREFNVEIVDSIEDLLAKVDFVFLLTNDGRPHLEQYLPVAKSRKPCFIDKPLAASLVDAVAIFELARKYDAPVFSSSSLRFDQTSIAVRNGSIGNVNRCEATSPATIEQHHPDLFWYGIHGVESLFTVLGEGCQSVTRKTNASGKIEVVGMWSDNRVGVFREDRAYSGTATGSSGQSTVGSSTNFEPLVSEIVKFARTGTPPVSEAETLEIYAFMEAADESKRRKGAPVSLNSVLTKARAEAADKLADGKL